jgi:peptidoglycan/LPS O-acetylase OafA/YrhL
MVVASHATGTAAHYCSREPFYGVFGVGYAGVDFFFVLSGFIIATVHADDPGHPGRFSSFAWKRFFRIFPSYWIVLSGLIAAGFLLPSLDRASHNQLAAIMKSIVLWPASDTENILSVAWTLSYELLFYAVFSLAILHKRFGYFAFVVWQVAVLLANLNGSPATFFLQLINFDFLFGVAVAWSPISRFGKRCTALGLVGFLVAASAAALNATLMQTRLSVFVFGLSSALVVYGLKCVEAIPLQMPAFLMLLGASSYSIYLVHYPVIGLCSALLPGFSKMSPEMVFALLFVAGCGAGVVFYKLVESPMLQYFRRSKDNASAASA